MLKKDLKTAIAMLGLVALPLFAQASSVEDSVHALLADSDSMTSGSDMMSQQPMEAKSSSKQSYMSGEKVKEGQLPGAYSQNAGYFCDDGWDVYVTGDYIYWDWVQDEGMSVGFNGLSVFSGFDFNLTPTTITPGYASGFQVGLGFNMKGMDDWNFYGEYTWYKNQASESFDAVKTSPAITTDFAGSADISFAYNNADFSLQRHFYFGKKLTGNFSTGLRALWINSDADAMISGSGSIVGSRSIAIDSILKSTHNDVSSWALGPKFGFDSNWLLGYGFKILGNMSASVLYTRYTGSSETLTIGSGTFVGSSFSLNSETNIDTPNYGTIRPVLDTFLGLGWGSYFYDEAFHFDLSAGYDFNVHWNYVTAVELAGYKNSSNLYLHGVNVQARFDF